ncbi:MAG: sensor histidine kinase [Spirochaetota bacterium]
MDSDQRLLSFLDRSPDLISELSPDGRYRNVNQTFESFLGCTKSDLIGKALEDVLPPEVAQLFRERLQQVVTSGRQLKVEDTLASDARHVSFSTVLFPLHGPDGTVRSVGCISRDITDRVRATEALQKKHDEIALLLREIHHRIKNNFAAVEGLLSLHGDRNENDEVARPLQLVQAQVSGMRILYERMLRTDSYAHASLLTYLSTLSSQVIALFSHERSVGLSCSGDDMEIAADQIFPLGLITAELITNSLKYAFPDHIMNPGITVSVRNEGAFCLLTVSDNGKGLPEHFDHARSPTLGLNLVRMMSEQIGGTLRIEPNTGHGTRSIVQFPL